MVLDSIDDLFFLIANFDFGKNIIIIIVADNSSSTHTSNTKKLVLGEEPTQWLHDTSITEEAEYSININASEKNLSYSVKKRKSELQWK